MIILVKSINSNRHNYYTVALSQYKGDDLIDGN